jgi:catalase (peroxidase I)
MKRVGDAKLESGAFRVVKGGAAHALIWPTLPSIPDSGSLPEDGAQANTLSNGQVVEIAELKWGNASSLLGRLSDGKGWVLVVSPKHGALFERVVEGYNNEGEREAINGMKTVKHQMMLVADMVLLWDPEFKKYLDVYAQDEEKLKHDFGVAYKKLTELGVPDLKAPGAEDGAASAI